MYDFDNFNFVEVCFMAQDLTYFVEVSVSIQKKRILCCCWV